MSFASPKPLSPSGPNYSSRERSLVPVGMATILPHAARQVRFLEEQLLTEVTRWGYGEIILPTFEYLDVLAPGLEAELLEKCYQFADRTTGRILLLRPDATAQIARTVAMGLAGGCVPLRLSYRTSVFRYEPEHAGRDREVFQVGAELIGVSDASGDGEVIALLIACLRRIGLSSFKVSLGHVGFFKGLLIRAGLTPEGRKRAEQAAARKDLPRLEEVLAEEQVGRAAARAILEAPELYGQREILARGRALAGKDRRLLSTLDRLEQVYELLASAGHESLLLLDLGEFRGFDYYDGVVFDVFAEGLGSELGGGGRYDHLIGRFGRELPSTGFAVDVDRLFRLIANAEVEQSSTGIDFLVTGPSRVAGQLIEVSAALRSADRRTVQRTLAVADHRMVQSAIETALEQHARTVVLLGAPGLDANEALLMDLSSANRSAHSRRHRPAFKRIKVSELPGYTARSLT